MQKIRAVVFDLDGTLLNTLDDLAAAVNVALATHQMPVRTLDEVRQRVGNGVKNLILRSVPDGTDEATALAVLATFKAYYAEHSMDATAPYEGIPALLASLHKAGVAMAVVSNKLESAVEALRQHFFADTVTLAVGDLPTRPVKPAPDGTLWALQQLGVSPQEALFVGDSDVDIVTARNAGMPCLSVSWGFRDEAFLRQSGAETVVATVAEAQARIMERV